MSDPAFAVWTVFRGARRWWLARGCPPTVCDVRRWVRAVRVSALLGLTGLASSWVSSAWPLIGALEELAPGINGEYGLVFWPGVAFGAVVLLPMSRWMGRGWWLSLAAIPVSAALYFNAVGLFFATHNLLNGSARDATWGGCLAGLLGGAGVGVWMCHVTRPRTWLVALLAGIAGGLGGLATGVNWHGERLPLPSEVEWLGWILAMNFCFSPFQVLVALAVGVRLWWMPPQLSPNDEGSKPEAGLAA